VLATPVLEALHKRYPSAYLDVLVRQGNEGLLLGHPYVRHVLIFDKKKSKLAHLWKLLLAVRRERYDAVINLHRFASSGVIAGFSGAKIRAGFDKNPISFRYTHTAKHEIGNGKHEVRRNLDLIAPWVGQVTFRPTLYPTAQDEKMVSFHKSKRPYVCIAPTSVWFTKQWAKERWMELLRLIPASYTIYVLGAPGDRALCDEIIQKSGVTHAVNLCGQLTFLQSVALMKDAKMNYVNDSAPLHFASSVNAPVTAIFCSTIPAFGFGPLSDVAHVIETQEALKCRPCGLHGHESCPDGHFRCALSISAERVAATLPA
jgi:heptosyltransferase-2